MNPSRLLPSACSVLCVLAASTHGGSVDGPWIRKIERLPETATEGAVPERPDEVRLEIASRRYVPSDGGAGSVTLVGVTHIGDAGYYEALAEALGEHDLVLYESVAPAGAKGASGEDAASRIAATRDALALTGVGLEWVRSRDDGLPRDLEGLRDAAGGIDTRLPGWLAAASRDAWGRPLVYTVVESEGTPDWRLESLGRDGRPGGEGEDADLRLQAGDHQVSPPSKGGIQARMASALGLSFQLHALDYDRPGWVLADMTEDELHASAAALGVDPGPLLEGLGGGGAAARLGRTLLMLVRIADFFSGNQVRDIVKVVLVEALSDPAAMELAGSGAAGLDGLMELILIERNRVALEELDSIRARHPERDLALFYGAAHMPGLAEGLRSRGLVPEGEASWLPAISVDLEASRVDPDTMRLIRSRFDATLESARRELPGTPAGEQD